MGAVFGGVVGAERLASELGGSRYPIAICSLPILRDGHDSKNEDFDWL